MVRGGGACRAVLPVFLGSSTHPRCNKTAPPPPPPRAGGAGRHGKGEAQGRQGGGGRWERPLLVAQACRPGWLAGLREEAVLAPLPWTAAARTLTPLAHPHLAPWRPPPHWPWRMAWPSSPWPIPRSTPCTPAVSAGGVGGVGGSAWVWGWRARRLRTPTSSRHAGPACPHAGAAPEGHPPPRYPGVTLASEPSRAGRRPRCAPAGPVPAPTRPVGVLEAGLCPCRGPGGRGRAHLGAYLRGSRSRTPCLRSPCVGAPPRASQAPSACQSHHLNQWLSARGGWPRRRRARPPAPV